MTDRKLTAVSTVYRAWWDGYEGWDGAATYADLDTAKACATADYVRDEYGAGTVPLGLRWQAAGARWELIDGDEATPVYVYADRVLGPATTDPPADVDWLRVHGA